MGGPCVGRHEVILEIKVKEQGRGLVQDLGRMDQVQAAEETL